MKSSASVRTQARERRRVALHAAGHLVIGEHLELHVCGAVIWQVRDIGLDEKIWHGQVFYDPCELDCLTRAERAMFGVAGTIAEEVWLERRTGSDRLEWDDLLSYPDSFSFSDWRLTGCEPGDPDAFLQAIVEQVARLFDGSLHDVLSGAARTLIRNSQSKMP